MHPGRSSPTIFAGRRSRKRYAYATIAGVARVAILRPSERFGFQVLEGVTHNDPPVALTRKNYLFAGSDAGAERAAIAYSILGCCALADVDPVTYLGDVLARLARGIVLRDAPQLLPLAWKTRRSLA